MSSQAEIQSSLVHALDEVSCHKSGNKALVMDIVHGVRRTRTQARDNRAKSRSTMIVDGMCVSMESECRWHEMHA